MSGPIKTVRPDYRKEPMEVWEEPQFSVYDPWTAQVIGTFPTREDADLFIAARLRKWGRGADE